MTGLAGNGLVVRESVKDGADTVGCADCKPHLRTAQRNLIVAVVKALQIVDKSISAGNTGSTCHGGSHCRIFG